ncbi:ribosomal RNA processing protein 36 homolog [Stylophora pistillata]|uniref:rRNA biogenesis protein RRP36 n=1 Tax=Stylophora pistillata TaxID=50429 RepID=A0A2B4RGF2_STYPI|nr:ribosomal RNA processing protein 36 homolog [Stylophora pistillata]PFX17444.1 Ribosomal RNA processing protein 36-like [Stylophora pistillata]
MDQNDPDDDSSKSSDDDASPDNSDVGEEGQIGRLKEELSEIPFCELEELKHKVGSKRYNEAIHGLFDKKGTNVTKSLKRENKNRPRELSSKKPVPRLRQVIPVKKKMARDPRFDELSGTFNQEMFDKAYSFLDDVKANEKKKLQKEVQKTKQPERKLQLESLLKRMDQQEATKKAAAQKRDVERKRKKAELELVKQGKTPYYLKKSDKKKLELAEKFKKLKSSGKLEQYLKKRGKKNTSKERKKMPHRRVMEV